jgi:hypothetical protein
MNPVNGNEVAQCRYRQRVRTLIPGLCMDRNHKQSLAVMVKLGGSQRQ